ncbi:MAG: hypothetical protein JW900_05280 [Anaerolineae bacterium]|nr:hypothetical protein [Anaerolineae bacterium]
MSKKRPFTALVILLVLLSIGSIAWIAQGYEITRFVVANGGSRVEWGSYALGATVGQAVVGLVEQAPTSTAPAFGAGRCTRSTCR